MLNSHPHHHVFNSTVQYTVRRRFPCSRFNNRGRWEGLGREEKRREKKHHRVQCRCGIALLVAVIGNLLSLSHGCNFLCQCHRLLPHPGVASAYVASSVTRGSLTQHGHPAAASEQVKKKKRRVKKREARAARRTRGCSLHERGAVRKCLQYFPVKRNLWQVQLGGCNDTV
jgi:hypothetical protein